MDVVRRDRLRELLASLWRLKYGLQSAARKDCVIRLTQLQFERGSRGRRGAGSTADARWRATTVETYRFVGRVIDEWVADACPDCHGRGVKGGTRMQFGAVRGVCGPCAGSGRVDHWSAAMLDLLMHGDHDGQVAVPVKKPCLPCLGRGWTSRMVKHAAERERSCSTCGGAGKRRLIDPALDAPRMAALKITRADYAYRWQRRFLDLHAMLARVDAELQQGLQSEMKRGSIHHR
jgi:hypothetical protein